MRVITGTARGRRLLTLEGNDVRPTTDRVKEALFSIVQFELEGRRILDLFAGSGQLGVEALSRGADSCVFIDSSRQAIEIVKKNLAATGLSRKASVLHGDALRYLQTSRDCFDLALLDPPYGTGLLQKALPLLPRLMRKTGAIVCETPKGEALPQQVGDFKQSRCYHYGKVTLTVYRVPEEEAEDDG